MVYSLTPTTNIVSDSQGISGGSGILSGKAYKRDICRGKKKVQYRENTATFLGRKVGLAQGSHPWFMLETNSQLQWHPTGVDCLKFKVI
jgi:hypothetical protein